MRTAAPADGAAVRTTGFAAPAQAVGSVHRIRVFHTRRGGEHAGTASTLTRHYYCDAELALLP